MIELLKHQQEFVEATEHEVMMLAPTATGKTFAQLYDAREFALNHPESIQGYISDNAGYLECFFPWDMLKNYKFNKINNCVEFENGSKIYFVGMQSGPYLLNVVETFRVYLIDILRIDTGIFQMSRLFYEETILQASRPPSCRPKQIKITANDTLHSISKSGRFKIIEPQEPLNPYLNIPTRLDGEWIKDEK